MKENIVIINGSKSFYPSTLLIPSSLKVILDEKIAKFGNLEKLFHFVVNSSHSALKEKSRSGHAKIFYQSRGLSLKRFDFFPNNEDWEIFRSYAWNQRVSMTLLFVKVLMAWQEFEKKGCIVPRKIEQIRLLQTLTINEIFTFLDLEHIIL